MVGIVMSWYSSATFPNLFVPVPSRLWWLWWQLKGLCLTSLTSAANRPQSAKCCSCWSCWWCTSRFSHWSGCLGLLSLQLPPPVCFTLTILPMNLRLPGLQVQQPRGKSLFFFWFKYGNVVSIKIWPWESRQGETEDTQGGVSRNVSRKSFC